jgi:hypothetical protein
VAKKKAKPRTKSHAKRVSGRPGVKRKAVRRASPKKKAGAKQARRRTPRKAASRKSARRAAPKKKAPAKKKPATRSVGDVGNEGDEGERSMRDIQAAAPSRGRPPTLAAPLDDDHARAPRARSPVAPSRARSEPPIEFFETQRVRS